MLGRAEVGQLDALAVAVVDPDELADRKASQVARAGLLEPPVRGLGRVVVVVLGDQQAVGQDRQVARGPQVEGQGRPDRGQVDGRQPMPGPLGLVIGDRVAGVGAEVEPGRRVVDAVAQGQASGRVALGPARPGDAQLAAVVTPAQLVAVEILDGADLQGDRVELELARAGSSPDQRVGDRAGGRASVDVDLQIDVEVDRLDAEVGWIVGFGPRQGEVTVGVPMMGETSEAGAVVVHEAPRDPARLGRARPRQTRSHDPWGTRARPGRRGPTSRRCLRDGCR